MIAVINLLNPCCLINGTCRLANVLINHCGLQRGDTLIVILPRIPEWWIIYIAAIRAGKNVSPLCKKIIRIPPPPPPPLAPSLSKQQ